MVYIIGTQLLRAKSKIMHTSANSAYAVTLLVPRRFTHICFRFATANIAYARTLAAILNLIDSEKTITNYHRRYFFA